MNDSTSITVLMTVYNAMPYLPDAVNSILNQSFKNFFFLIIDDGSTDGSFEFINSVSDERILSYSIEHRGIIGALNCGLNKIGTEYFAIMDADDLSDVNRLKEQFDFLEKNKDYVLIGSSILYIGEKENDKIFRVKLPENDYEIKDGLERGRFVIHHSTVMMKTKIVKNILGYRQESFPNPDYDLFLRLSGKGKFKNLQNTFCRIRIHRRSHTSINLKEIIKSLYTLTNKNSFLSRMFFYPSFLSLKTYRNGIDNYVSGNQVYGILLIILAGFINPSKAFYFIKNKLF